MGKNVRVIITRHNPRMWYAGMIGEEYEGILFDGDVKIRDKDGYLNYIYNGDYEIMTNSNAKEEPMTEQNQIPH